MCYIKNNINKQNSPSIFTLKFLSFGFVFLVGLFWSPVSLDRFLLAGLLGSLISLCFQSHLVSSLRFQSFWSSAVFFGPQSFLVSCLSWFPVSFSLWSPVFWFPVSLVFGGLSWSPVSFVLRSLWSPVSLGLWSLLFLGLPCSLVSLGLWSLLVFGLSWSPVPLDFRSPLVFNKFENHVR